MLNVNGRNLQPIKMCLQFPTTIRVCFILHTQVSKHAGETNSLWVPVVCCEMKASCGLFAWLSRQRISRTATVRTVFFLIVWRVNVIKRQLHYSSGLLPFSAVTAVSIAYFCVLTTKITFVTPQLQSLTWHSCSCLKCSTNKPRFFFSSLGMLAEKGYGPWAYFTSGLSLQSISP